MHSSLSIVIKFNINLIFKLKYSLLFIQFHLYARFYLQGSAARQINIKDLFKGGSIKETMGCLISKFFIYESVAPHKTNSHHFKNMITGAQQVGIINYYIFILFKCNIL